MEQDAASRALDCMLASLVVHLSGRVPNQPHHGEHAAADSHAVALVLCADNIAILADFLHMLIVLPAIRLLVPARQHFVVFGFALIVGIATLSAVYTLLTSDYLTAQPVWPSAYQLEDWYWRPFRDVINCIVVLAIVIWYGIRLHRDQPHPH